MSDKPKIYKSGNLRADKIQYKDGIGCCIWYPMQIPNDKGIMEEESGICFDFSFVDIHDMKALLNMLIDATADTYDPPEESDDNGDWVIPEEDIVEDDYLDHEKLADDILDAEFLSEEEFDEFLKGLEEGEDKKDDK